MTAETFNANFRVLPPKEATSVPEVPADAPDDLSPPRYRTVTRGAILAAYPHLGYLADPAQPVREPSEYEAAVYENRRSDPEWADLYRLVAEGDAFAARVRVLAGPEPLLPAPVAAAPEPAGDPAQPEAEDVSPQPEAAEPAADETRVIEPADEHTALLPPVEPPTAMLPAVTDTQAIDPGHALTEQIHKVEDGEGK
jgi:hypothetical protein